MTPLQWFQLALGLIKLANWAAAKIDQATWKRQGYQQAIDEQTAALRKAAGLAAAVAEETKKMTPEEIRRDLDGNHEFRD